MILPNPEHHGLVRGRIICGTHRAGCVSLDLALDPECTDCIVAYTPYHRHDDDPEIVARELRALETVYMGFHDVGGMMVGYEYRPYKG